MENISNNNIQYMRKKAKKNRDKSDMPVVAIFLAVFLVIYSASLIGMILWGFINSLKTTDDFMSNMVGLPKGNILDWAWNNYVVAFDALSTKIIVNGSLKTIYVETMLLNSVIFATMRAVVTISTTWVMAYITTQFKFKICKFIYAMVLVLMMIPIIGSLPSSLQIYTKLGLYDTWGYVFISSIGFVGGNYLIFHAYFSTVSTEIKEAAMIDGAGNWNIMLRIVLPMTANMFFVLLLSTFITNWNDYMTMVIWLPSKPNLAYGIYKFSTSLDTSGRWPPVQFAGCIILVLPILTLFIIFKDKLIGRVSIGQLK